MTITWYGQSCFRIDTREGTLAIDPFSKETGLTPPRFSADIVLITHGHPDHANADAIGGEPFIIAGPGEYEVKGIAITGIPSFHDQSNGKERGGNTIYRIEIPSDGTILAHLGDFGEDALREETLEALGDIDILFVPVGGKYTIDGATAARIAHQIEPRVVIPMHYKIPGLTYDLAPVDQFLKSYGTTSDERLEKFVVKRKDLPENETRVVVLQVG